MADYIAKLRQGHAQNTDDPTVEVEALTEFEAAAVALNRFLQAGEKFDASTGLELLQGNVTHSKPVPVKDIVHWLRDRPEGRALAERDNLQSLLDYVAS